MTAIQQNPQNSNFQFQHNFKFWIRKLPAINFFCTKIHCPGITAGTATFHTPTFKIPLTGDHPDYENLIVEFNVDEDLANWYEVFKWIKGDTFPDSTNEYKNLDDNLTPDFGLEADAILFILDSNKNPTHFFAFTDVKPISLSGLDFNSTTQSAEILTSQVSFNITTYDLHTII